MKPATTFPVYFVAGLMFLTDHQAKAAAAAKANLDNEHVEIEFINVRMPIRRKTLKVIQPDRGLRREREAS